MPWLLLSLAVLVAMVQLIVGVPITGRYYAHDGPFAVASLVQFEAELRAGHLVPRWLVSGNAGLGAPVFLFYPPGAYDFAALLAAALPRFSAATIIGLTQVLLRGAAMLTCFVWLRRRADLAAALTGSALYVLMPCIAIENPQVRLAFAECAATALVPLAFWSIDTGLAADTQCRFPLRTITLLALAIFALTLVHLPTTVTIGGLAVIYAALSADTWRKAVWAGGAGVGGIVLGLGLAGGTLVPAIGLLPAISSSAWWNFSMYEHFMLTPSSFLSPRPLLLDASLLIPILLAASFCGAAIVRNRRGGVSPNLPWALVGSLLAAGFLTLPFSAPAWSLLRPLRMIQYPSRFLVPVSLLSAGLVAVTMASCTVVLRRVAFGAGVALGVAAIFMAVWLGDGMSSGTVRTWQALHPQPILAEYIPIEAVKAGWFDATHGSVVEQAERAPALVARAAKHVSVCVQRPQTPQDVGDTRLTFDVSHCAGVTMLPQFYFPGWRAEADGGTLQVTADSASGLVAVVIPPGTGTISLHRTELPIEWFGQVLSLACLGVWLGGFRLSFASWPKQRTA